MDSRTVTTDGRIIPGAAAHFARVGREEQFRIVEEAQRFLQTASACDDCSLSTMLRPAAEKAAKIMESFFTVTIEPRDKQC